MRTPIVDIIVEAELIDNIYELDLLSNVDYNLESDIEMVTHVSGNPYQGPYSVIPNTTEQVLNTKDLLCEENITVGAIPSNYGLITWNGSVLTVS